MLICDCQTCRAQHRRRQRAKLGRWFWNAAFALITIATLAAVSLLAYYAVGAIREAITQ